ncbi:hypothetical protein BC833DRAFT_602397 [Globomyces pollinis-pini]|nr:hypothetical protein BC833DRAFT_602397 [Globomyces pollinis-pini]
MITQETIILLLTIALLCTGISSLVGLINLIWSLFSNRNRKNWNRYSVLVLTLKFLVVELNVANLILMIITPTLKINNLVYRILKIVTYWPLFVFHLLLMYSNMEMMKLFYVITPFFTPQRIRIIQIVEISICFVVGGGLIYWPISDLGEFAFNWGTVSSALPIISESTVICQCLYLSIKMKQFASKSKSTVQNSQWNYKKSIFLVLTFTILLIISVGIWCRSIALFGKDAPQLQNIAGELGLILSTAVLPLSIFLYSQIFESIKGIKFEVKSGTNNTVRSKGKGKTLKQSEAGVSV